MEVARIITEDETATARDGVLWTRKLVDDLKIPGLSAYGMNESKFTEAIDKTLKASSFKGNAIALNENELREILEKAL
jgi:alcohol dehydrogenase class IV